MRFISQEYAGATACDRNSFDAPMEFLSLVRKKTYVGKIVVLNSVNLRNRKSFFLSRYAEYKEFPSENLPRDDDLIRACVSHGHLSVLFLPQNINELVLEFLAFGFYSPVVRYTELDINANDLNSLTSFAIAGNLSEFQGCLFSHDADYFYVLRAEVSFPGSLRDTH
jgi:hypothetical protein